MGRFLSHFTKRLQDPYLHHRIDYLSKQISWEKIYCIYKAIYAFSSYLNEEVVFFDYDPYSNNIIEKRISSEEISLEKNPYYLPYLFKLFGIYGIEILDYNEFIRETTPEEHKLPHHNYYHEVRYKILI